MKLTSKDFRAIKMPAIALAVAIAASVSMISYTSNQHSRSESRYRSQLSALEQARIRFQRSGEERETVVHYVQTYRQLENIGFIGAEHRLNWIDSLREANAQAGSFGVDFQITAQESFPYVPKDNPIANRIRQSKMVLTFGLLHEGDLMKLFRALVARQPGLFWITACSLDRAGKEGLPLPRQANLTAQCELSWVTIERKEEKS
jgi:hypothetical protein